MGQFKGKKSGYWKKKTLKSLREFHMFGTMWQCKQSNIEGRINLLLLQMDVSMLLTTFKS